MRALVFAHYLAPSRHIAARRFDAMVAGMAARGWALSVIAPPIGLRRPADPALIPPDMPLIEAAGWAAPETVSRWAFAPVRRLLGASGHGLAGLAGPALRAWLTGLRALDLTDEFAPWSAQALVVARRAVATRRPDLIYASVPPMTPARAALALAQETGCALVIDYRDPWSDPRTAAAMRRLAPQTLARHSATEDAVLQEAIAVLTVSSHLSSALAARTDARVLTVPHGVPRLPDDGAVPPGLPDRFVLYAGSLFYGRGLDAALRALSGLGMAGVPLVYCGPSSAAARADAARAGAPDLLIDLGPCDYASVAALSARALANVLLVTEAYPYMIPGKLWEQVAAGRPIVAIAPRGGAAEALITQERVGVCLAPGDEAGLGEALRRALAGDIAVDPLARVRLARERVIDQALADLEGLIGARSGASPA